MKKIFIALFLVSALFSYSQQKKDSKIIVNLTDTTGIFNKVVAVLYEHGYDLETNNPQLGFISTKDKEMKKYAVKGKIRMQIKEKELIFTSQMRLSFRSAFGDMYSDVSYIGAKHSPMREVWNEMDAIAKQFGAVTYSK